MAHINDFFHGAGCQFDELVAYLDALDQATRIRETVGLTSAQQQALWAAAEHSPRLTMDYFVPPDKAPLEEVVHWGKNSLPLFTDFKKVMCRTGNENQHAGYNVYALRALITAGYFVTRRTSADEADDHGIVIDYTQVPTEKVADWPPIVPCTQRLGRFFYGGNYDYMRRVSEHVTIGRAKKAKAAHDKWMPNWFVLCRED